MKFYKSKTAKFLAGKGFYLVLAVCMTAMAIAVYSALDSANLEEGGESSSIYETPSEIVPPVVSDQSEPQEEIDNLEEEDQDQTEPADVEGQAGYFIMPVEAQVIKSYDSQHLQYSATYNDMRLHKGTDLKPVGSNDVLSAGKGIVTIVEENTVYGNVVTIDHFDGVLIRYCGVKNITVKTNDEVKAGDILGEVGVVTNESSDELHLHIEVFKDGKDVNPEEFFGY